jgi:hypothetical protein
VHPVLRCASCGTARSTSRWRVYAEAPSEATCEALQKLSEALGA